VVPKWTQKMLLALAAGALSLAPSGAASAQDASKTSTQASPEQQDALPGNSAQLEQPMSLGDMARLARAQKQTENKAAKVIDDDNLPRSGGGINVVGGAQGDSPAGPSSSRSRAGKVVLLDFWASWCGPCRQSVPDLKELQKAYGSDQLEVISVNEDKNEGAGRSFVAQNQMNWEQRFDSDGEMSRQYGVHAFPTFVLTDGNGTVLQRFVGEDPNQPLANRIGPYLSKYSNGSS
jgi:thiol-disulfide isomerase/thioredoxin